MTKDPQLWTRSQTLLHEKKQFIVLKESVWKLQEKTAHVAQVHLLSTKMATPHFTATSCVTCGQNKGGFGAYADVYLI